MLLDKRASTLLKTLIEKYIAEGQPVGSRALSQLPGLDVSPATIRNIMADLEEMGLLTSPHTSAGRIPTPKGYRVFVDSLLTVQDLDRTPLLRELTSNFKEEYSPKKIIANAAQTLSSLSHFAGVVLTPRTETTIAQIEFVKLSDQRILLVIVDQNGYIQNRLLLVQQDYTSSQLVQASNYINSHCKGMTLHEIHHHIKTELRQLQDDITQLMHTAVEATTEIDDENEEVVISGERNLLKVDDLSSNMLSLRKLFDVLEQKTSLIQLLNISNKASGIQIFIGGESNMIPVDEMSVITAPYHVNNQIVGTLGVIGPTRMAYERVIPVVDMTAKLLSNALSHT